MPIDSPDDMAPEGVGLDALNLSPSDATDPPSPATQTTVEEVVGATDTTLPASPTDTPAMGTTTQPAAKDELAPSKDVLSKDILDKDVLNKEWLNTTTNSPDQDAPVSTPSGAADPTPATRPPSVEEAVTARSEDGALDVEDKEATPVTVFPSLVTGVALDDVTNVVVDTVANTAATEYYLPAVTASSVVTEMVNLLNELPTSVTEGSVSEGRETVTTSGEDAMPVTTLAAESEAPVVTPPSARGRAFIDVSVPAAVESEAPSNAPPESEATPVTNVSPASEAVPEVGGTSADKASPASEAPTNEPSPASEASPANLIALDTESKSGAPAATEGPAASEAEAGMTTESDVQAVTELSSGGVAQETSRALPTASSTEKGVTASEAVTEVSEALQPIAVTLVQEFATTARADASWTKSPSSDEVPVGSDKVMTAEPTVGEVPDSVTPASEAHGSSQVVPADKGVIEVLTTPAPVSSEATSATTLASETAEKVSQDLLAEMPSPALEVVSESQTTTDAKTTVSPGASSFEISSEAATASYSTTPEPTASQAVQSEAPMTAASRASEAALVHDATSPESPETSASPAASETPVTAASEEWRGVTQAGAARPINEDASSTAGPLPTVARPASEAHLASEPPAGPEADEEPPAEAPARPVVAKPAEPSAAPSPANPSTSSGRSSNSSNGISSNPDCPKDVMEADVRFIVILVLLAALSILGVSVVVLVMKFRVKPRRTISMSVSIHQQPVDYGWACSHLLSLVFSVSSEGKRYRNGMGPA